MLSDEHTGDAIIGANAINILLHDRNHSSATLTNGCVKVINRGFNDLKIFRFSQYNVLRIRFRNDIGRLANNPVIIAELGQFRNRK